MTPASPWCLLLLVMLAPLGHASRIATVVAESDLAEVAAAAEVADQIVVEPASGAPHAKEASGPATAAAAAGDQQRQPQSRPKKRRPRRKPDKDAPAAASEDAASEAADAELASSKDATPEATESLHALSAAKADPSASSSQTTLDKLSGSRASQKQLPAKPTKVVKSKAASPAEVASPRSREKVQFANLAAAATAAPAAPAAPALPAAQAAAAAAAPEGTLSAPGGVLKAPQDLTKGDVVVILVGSYDGQIAQLSERTEEPPRFWLADLVKPKEPDGRIVVKLQDIENVEVEYSSIKMGKDRKMVLGVLRHKVKLIGKGPVNGWWRVISAEGKELLVSWKDLKALNAPASRDRNEMLYAMLDERPRSRRSSRTQLPVEPDEVESGAPESQVRRMPAAAAAALEERPRSRRPSQSGLAALPEEVESGALESQVRPMLAAPADKRKPAQKQVAASSGASHGHWPGAANVDTQDKARNGVARPADNQGAITKQLSEDKQEAGDGVAPEPAAGIPKETASDQKSTAICTLPLASLLAFVVVAV